MTGLTSHIVNHGAQYIVVVLLGLSGTGFVSYMDIRYLSSTQYSKDRLDDRIETVRQALVDVRLQINQNEQFDKYKDNPAYGFIIADLKQVEADLNKRLDILLAKVNTKDK